MTCEALGSHTENIFFQKWLGGSITDMNLSFNPTCRAQGLEGRAGLRNRRPKIHPIQGCWKAGVKCKLGGLSEGPPSGPPVCRRGL